MRIGVVSDSHGNLFNAEKVSRVLAETDLIIHLGDVLPDAKWLESRSGRHVLAVAGNCDFSADEPQERILLLAGTRVLIAHGHRYGVKSGLYRLSLRAAETGAQLALFGHTHQPHISRDGDLWLVNPGALRDGCYAVIELEPGRISPHLAHV